jgi:hypothetical protein
MLPVPLHRVLTDLGLPQVEVEAQEREEAAVTFDAP